jgi:uncharacterized alkaline shock family protein YloU
VSDQPTSRSSVVSRRAVTDIVRAAVRTSYGVTGVDAGPVDRLLGALRLREPGIRVRLRPRLEIDLDVTVGSNVPIAEVARQLDSAVRYAVGEATGQAIDRLTIHVEGLHYRPASTPPARATTADAPSAAPVVADEAPTAGEPAGAPLDCVHTTEGRPPAAAA